MSPSIISIHPGEGSCIWTMGKEIPSPLGELRREGEERNDSGVG